MVWILCTRFARHSMTNAEDDPLKPFRKAGFTLIEMSLVLVIIGLIVGGILVGQSLVKAAEVRATVTQEDKYNQAVNTFRDKYNGLPGDLNAASASQFGFVARGSVPGTGDGDGNVTAYEPQAGPWGGVGAYSGMNTPSGEVAVFWVDLSMAHLIDASLSGANETAYPVSGSVTPDSLFPQAKIGNGNYFYVYNYNSVNYFGLSVPTLYPGTNGISGELSTTPGLTVAQAAAIDSKMDDGLPQSGNVTAFYLGAASVNQVTYAPSYNTHPPNLITYAVPGSSSTCFDNSSSSSGSPGVAGATAHYSLEISNGANVTCALSFRFQ